MSESSIPEPIAKNLELCRLYLAEEERREAWGQMHQILDYYLKEKVELPPEIKDLWDEMFIGDGLAAVEANQSGK